MASDILYGNDAFSILLISTKKRYSSYLKKWYSSSFSRKSASNLGMEIVKNFHELSDKNMAISHTEGYFFFRIFFFFFYMYMIVWSKQNTFSFVNTMPKYIHSNINPIYTYTNTGVINMFMHIYIYIYTYINYIHTYMQTHIHTHAHTHTHIYIYTYIQIYIYIYIDAYIYLFSQMKLIKKKEERTSARPLHNTT